VFISSVSGGLDDYLRSIYRYGCIPSRFTSGETIEIDDSNLISGYIRDTVLDEDELMPPVATLFTSVFMHGGIFHLLGNMWFLWLFGDNVEDRFGRLLFPIFYIACGIIAGLIHIFAEWGSTVPAVGASGAIAGVMGAYIYMFPRGSIATLWGYWWYWTTIHVPASVYLGIWFVLQLLGGFASSGSNVAFWAHIGGFLAGLILTILFHKLGLITWWPGDRGYNDGAGGLPFRAGGRRVTTMSYNSPPRRRKRYVWRE